MTAHLKTNQKTTGAWKDILNDRETFSGQTQSNGVTDPEWADKQTETKSVFTLHIIMQWSMMTNKKCIMSILITLMLSHIRYLSNLQW